MVKRFIIVISVVLVSAVFVPAQNTNSSATPSRTRTVAPKPTPTPKPVPRSTDDEASPTTRKAAAAAGQVSPSSAVLAAFNKIVNGIRHSNVDLYASGYWNSPSLILFNYNGSVTKGWEQMHKNREASFPDAADVKLDIHDYHMQLLGRDGAVVTCLWTQSQTFKGQPDTATGRMTLVFKRTGNEWKAVHLHTSADKPDPSRVPASEQQPPPPQSTP
jgi:ketosteroid isomerase-like protein